MPRDSNAGLTAAGERPGGPSRRRNVILESGEEVHVTVGVGGAVATDLADPDDGKRLVQEADAALYRAKADGPNRVVEVAPRRR